MRSNGINFLKKNLDVRLFFFLTIVACLCPIMSYTYTNNTNFYLSNNQDQGKKNYKRIQDFHSEQFKLGKFNGNPDQFLFYYSSEQLESYFKDLHYSENDILDQYELYISDEFIKIAKTYPSYEQRIKFLYQKMHSMNGVSRFLKIIFGFHSPDFEKRIDFLYMNIKDQELERSKLNYNFEILESRWKKVLKSNTDPIIAERINKRLDAFVKSSSTPIILHKGACLFAQQNNIGLLESVPSFSSSSITREIFQEYVNILETASQFSRDQNALLLETISQATNIGLEANVLENVDCASRMADFCWSLIDYALAIGEGIYMGTANTIHTLTHPLQTAQHTLMTVGMITSHLGKCLEVAGECVYLYMTDEDTFYVRSDAIINNLKDIIHSANMYLESASIHDYIKYGTAFVTEGMLLAKTLTFARNVSNKLLPLTQHALECFKEQEAIIYLSNDMAINFEILRPHNVHLFKDNVSKLDKKQLLSFTNKSCVLNNSYYEVNGFKFTEYYYNRLWENGRSFPGFRAEAILKGASMIIEDPKKHSGFYKYVYEDWEMIFNPETRIVSHLSKTKIIKNKRN